MDAMLDSNMTDSWDPELNWMELSGELGAKNTTGGMAGNETELDQMSTRIVGGILEKRGGSPWQVGQLRFSFTEKMRRTRKGCLALEEQRLKTFHCVFRF